MAGAAGGRDKVPVPDPDANEIELPDRYPPFAGAVVPAVPAVSPGFAIGAGAAAGGRVSDTRRRRPSTSPTASAISSSATTTMTIQIQVGTRT